MSNNTSSGFGAEGFHLSSSGSSDSEFFLDEDMQTNRNINKDWEAIERTLYQEPGQHVTDPELLRECKLWRETFPHFRVKGTKIEVNKPEGGDEEKNIQTLDNHLDIMKLKEKRESIKNKVVEELVERLIAKFNLNKGNCDKSLKGTSTVVKYPTSVDTNTEKESYFERGKPQTEDPGVSKKEMREKLFRVLDSWEKDDEKLRNSPEKAPGTQNNFDYLRVGSSHNSILKNSERIRFKQEKPVYTTNVVAKPFEMTKKIDKKYETLLERIIERQGSEIEPSRICRTTSSETGAKTRQQSFERLRLGSGFDDYLKRHRNIPRINKFKNNWLDRGEAYYRAIEDSKSFERYTDYKPQEPEERLLQQLKKEELVYKRPAKKTGESLRKPKPVKVDETTHKSFSCGNLLKHKKSTRSKPVKVGGEVGSSKSSAKLSIGKGSQGGLLPPIENSIICKELTGRPKVAARTPNKRY